jgi:glyoxylate reductase
MTVAVTRTDLPGLGMVRLATAAQLRVAAGDVPLERDALIELAADATAMICVSGDQMDAAFLERCPALRLLALISVGYDTVDVAAARELGVAVTNTPGVLHETVADLTFGLILAARRRLVEGDRLVRAGGWTESHYRLLFARDVHGARLGIVGYGEIGRAVARRAVGFGMNVVHHARTRHDDAISSWLPLDELLRTSDIVSLHVPLGVATQGMIGERELRLMQPTATLVNTARGGIVDEAALVRALNEGWIGSAGLDVQAVEPNPDPADPLLGAPNCVVLPHVGSATEATRGAMVDLAVENVVRFLEDRPLLTLIPELRV